MISAPIHDFDATGRDQMSHTVIVTPELRAWADDAAQQLADGGWPVPADLQVLRAGQTLTRNRWWWLLNSVLKPRPPCPF